MSQPENKAALFNRLLTESCTPADTAAIISWLGSAAAAEDPEAAALIREQLEAIPDASEVDPVVIQRLQALLPAVLMQEPAVAPHGRIRKMLTIAAAAAAAILIISTIAYLSLYKPPAPARVAVAVPGGNKATLTLADGTVVQLDSARKTILQGRQAIEQDNGNLRYGTAATTGMNTLVTPRGGQYTLQLPDGSKVWLNADSKLHYPAAFTGSERVVALEGEAFFEPATDQERPFKVVARGVTTRVLGTSFNISAYEEEETIKTTVLTGAVKVNTATKEQVLRPNQQGVVNNGTDISLKTVNAYKVASWKDGMIAFERLEVPAVMNMIARWYNVDISYEGAIPDVLMSGEFKRKVGLADALKIMNYSGINCELKGNTIVVY
ncbi:FecR family protein [Chitinophaga sp. sic0106]|uniref:FecR family protein n=1 Tax=Chitinophaga sp. sic0106 TaxID=2854785 RepID=UPI001C476B48|nr:FecR domain-containing protein [Chitinophaga sp. sic0106]MBV7529171.1 FecR domain-containing protein [Chitinophaga sp. sic0106]